MKELGKGSRNADGGQTTDSDGVGRDGSHKGGEMGRSPPGVREGGQAPQGEEWFGVPQVVSLKGLLGFGVGGEAQGVQRGRKQN